MVVTKKKSAVKHTKRRAVKTALKKASKENSFKVIDGSELHSLYELADALHAMSDDSYYYHVTDSRNDFSTWIEHVFHQKNLALEISQMRKVNAEVALLRFLVNKLHV